MKINDFFQIFGLQPWSIVLIRVKRKHFHSILVTNFEKFRTNSRYRPGLNNRPKKRRVRLGLQYKWLILRSRVLVTNIYGISYPGFILSLSPRLLYLDADKKIVSSLISLWNMEILGTKSETIFLNVHIWVHTSI